ncbi:MAG: hypothetical protein HYS13_04965 [Planctomycetia bacterium]|nr:hypothetical protein [Planctomycetia bacterium]
MTAEPSLPAEPAPSADAEIEPFVLCKVDGGQLQCALWRLAEGQLAVTLFLSADSAAAYRAANHLDAAWRAYRPLKSDLLTLLRECLDGGVPYAVLEPSATSSRRMYDLERVVREAMLGS